MSKDKCLHVGSKRNNSLTSSRLFGPDIYSAILDSVWENFEGSGFWLNEIFDDIQPKGSFPKLNVLETADEYIVEVAIAGFNKDDVEVELRDNTFYVKGEIKNVKEVEAKYLRKEISSRSFRRAVRFPEKIDADLTNCNYSDGILTCNVGKKITKSDKPVKIKIN